MSDETVMSKADFEELQHLLLVNCPKDSRSWLSEKLRYANELSLAKRIRRLIAPFKEYFGSSKKREWFVHKVVVTRNYMAHHDISLSEDAARGHELLELCDRLDGLLQLNLLKILGFTDDAIRAASRDYGSLWRLLGLNVRGLSSE